MDHKENRGDYRCGEPEGGHGQDYRRHQPRGLLCHPRSRGDACGRRPAALCLRLEGGSSLHAASGPCATSPRKESVSGSPAFASEVRTPDHRRWGRITATARAAVAAADFLIIPTLPSKFDLLSTENFVQTVLHEVQ